MYNDLHHLVCLCARVCVLCVCEQAQAVVTVVVILFGNSLNLVMVSERMNLNGEMLVKFRDELNLENLNKTVAEGPVTWSASNQESATDYVLVNGKMRDINCPEFHMRAIQTMS